MSASTLKRTSEGILLKSEGTWLEAQQVIKQHSVTSLMQKQMTWGRALENALKSKGISKDFDEWIAIAKDRSIGDSWPLHSQTP